MYSAWGSLSSQPCQKEDRLHTDKAAIKQRSTSSTLTATCLALYQPSLLNGAIRQWAVEFVRCEDDKASTPLDPLSLGSYSRSHSSSFVREPRPFLSDTGSQGMDGSSIYTGATTKRPSLVDTHHSPTATPVRLDNAKLFTGNRIIRGY